MSEQNKIPLCDADFLEKSPEFWSPMSDSARLAALVGYMTGDGSVGRTAGRYKNTVYEAHLAGAFYSNQMADLEAIRDHCLALGLTRTATVRPKIGKYEGYQLQLGRHATTRLVEAGVPVGDKTRQVFEVPQWVREGDDSTRRAYLAALFGAEGCAPAKDKSSKSRLPRSPMLSMCKNESVEGAIFFDQLKALSESLGVKASVLVYHDKARVVIQLVVDTGVDNLIAFYERIGFLYCARKQLLAWQWAHYLRAYKAAAERRRSTVLELRAAGASWATVGNAIGLTRGAAYRMHGDILGGKSTTAGHSFPHFDLWISERWLSDRNLLRLAITRKTPLPAQEVWNLKVSSPDHSYLLADGWNNFNSFETMSGRVYHAFDRRKNVKRCPFNPKLPIWVGQDFNNDPMSGVIMQPQPNGELWIVDEIVIHSSNTEEVTQEIDRRYFRYQKRVVIYPDPAGRHRQHARGESDLDIFRQAGYRKLKYRRKHPSIVDRTNAVNRMLKAADGTIRLFVNEHCKHTIQSFEQTIYKTNTREIDKKMGVEHCTDAVGYPVELEYPVRGKFNPVGVSI